MKAPKAPKLKKLPKKPRANAPVATWDKWHEKATAIRKENARKVSEHKKALSRIEGDKKKRAALIKKAQGLGNI